MKQRIHSTMNDWRPFLAIPDAPAVNADTTHRFPGRVITKLFHSAALLLAVCTLLSGCAGPVIATERIQIVAEPDANQSSATAVDLVFIYDQAALGVLPRTGPSWFASKEALMRGLATDIEVVPFEVPPGVQIDVSVPARSRSAIAVYSYANYLHPCGASGGFAEPVPRHCDSPPARSHQLFRHAVGETEARTPKKLQGPQQTR